MTKYYELAYYRETGMSDPIEQLADVQKLLFNETAEEFPVESLVEGATFYNNEGDLLMLVSFESEEEVEVEDE